MMMMTTANTNTPAQEKGVMVTSSLAEVTVKKSTNDRLHTVAKQLSKPVFSTMQPLSSFQNWEQETQTLVVIGTNKQPTSHKAKFQDNELINELQAQVNQVTHGLKQLACTQQFEEETLKLFNKMQKAFQANNTPLYQRHWNSWLQVIDLLEQQTSTLYGNVLTPANQAVVASYFESYCLPNWLTEKALPETKEALCTYQQFWLTQQQETEKRQKNAQHYNSQVQIKLENWLAAKTAPKSN
jgi:hypothetical protein